jgi:NAD(P)H-nitrite reductase large subunit
MMVCSCSRVSESAVLSAILSGACSPEQIAERCRAGARCGGCLPVVEELLAVHAPREMADSAA